MIISMIVCIQCVVLISISPLTFNSGCFDELVTANEITESFLAGLYRIAKRKDVPLQTDADEVLRFSHKPCSFLNCHRIWHNSLPFID